MTRPVPMQELIEMALEHPPATAREAARADGGSRAERAAELVATLIDKVAFFFPKSTSRRRNLRFFYFRATCC